MVVFNDNLLPIIPFDILAVDFGPGVFALAEGADIEIVVQNPLNGDNGPGRLGLPLAGYPFRLFAHLLGHPGGGNPLFCQRVGNFLIAPPFDIPLENPANNIRFRGHQLKLLAFVDNIAVRGCTEPRPVRLTALDDVAYLPGGVRHRHFVDQELELDFQPIVIVWKVDAVSDGDDPQSCVPEIFQLHQSPAVPTGKPGKVLHNEDIIFMGHQPPAHLLIPFPLLKGVAGTVPVLKEGQAAAGKPLLYIIFDNSLLVFNGDILLIQFVVHRNTDIARNVKMFCHTLHPLFIFCFFIIYR